MFTSRVQNAYKRKPIIFQFVSSELNNHHSYGNDALSGLIRDYDLQFMAPCQSNCVGAVMTNGHDHLIL